MSRFLSEKYAGLEAYTPGEQPRDKAYIKLNTNESPFPPSDGVIKAINAQAVEDLRLYSDPESKVLKTKLADRYGLETNQVYVANGSDDILNFAFMAFGDKGVAYPAISYGFYSVFADLYGIAPEEIPLEEDLSIDPCKFWNKGKLVVIANPNAPTGLTLSVAEIEEILKTNSDSVVVIDEAYVDFGAETCLPLLQTYDNLLVVQTFSKSRSMAGARLGFTFGSAEVIADLEKLKYSTNPYNINRLTQAAGAAALDEDAYYMENCRRIMENRDYAARELQKLGFTVTDSKANFLFAKSDTFPRDTLYRKLKDRGILVRHFTKPIIADYNRITVGSREEMETLIQTIQVLLEETP